MLALQRTRPLATAVSAALTPRRRRRHRPHPAACSSQPQAAPTASTASPKPHDLSAYVKSRAKLVNDALDKAVPATGRPEVLHDAMRYSLLAGGKRVRPVLCLAACEMVGGSTQDAMPTACAVELLHTMSLVHDDLPAMDDDDYRRGALTSHKVYGDDNAILAGDAMLALAFEVVARDTPGTVEPQRVLRVVRDLGRAAGASGLVGGQAVDLEMEGAARRGESVSMETLRYIHEHKTGALLEVAVCSGAILGGASAADVEKLRKYALDIGLAFQVVDDILDVTKSSQELGKTAGKDEASGKATYPALVGLDESRRIAKDLVSSAKAQLEGFDADKSWPLRELADFIYRRDH